MNFNWKHYRHGIEYAVVRFLAWFIPKLTRDECMGLAKIFGSVGFFFDRRGREVTLANLEAVFGDKYSPEQRYQIGIESYQNFARTMIDLFWCPRLLDPRNHRFLKVTGVENMPKRGERSAVVILSHKAGFEWTGPATALRGLSGVALTQGFKDPRIGEIFRGLRETLGQKVITQETSMLKMLRSARRGSFVGMLLDLNVRPSQASTIIDAFDRKMCVTILHAVVALRTKSPIVPMESEPLEDGSTQVTFHPAVNVPPDATVQQITQTCWNIFEPIFKAKPHLWMWSYKHLRFKPKGTTRDYPFYANHSGRFEKLLKSIEQP